MNPPDLRCLVEHHWQMHCLDAIITSNTWDGESDDTQQDPNGIYTDNGNFSRVCIYIIYIYIILVYVYVYVYT